MPQNRFWKKKAGKSGFLNITPVLADIIAPNTYSRPKVISTSTTSGLPLVLMGGPQVA